MNRDAGQNAQHQRAHCGRRRSPAHNLEWIIFEEDDDLGVFDFVGGKDAVFVVGLEEDDRGHEGASEVPGVLLGEGKIVLHVRAPSLERANPALDG
ncbi:MAG: hypothetical protein KDK08_18770, partial [Rhizobiaceae bacterium]|nr:hypothetical protein [Rhizobiaceae bacterium]